ncbi:MAG: hypothetical protein ACRDQ2_11725 [Gaiellales bacterium]
MDTPNRTKRRLAALAAGAVMVAGLPGTASAHDTKTSTGTRDSGDKLARVEAKCGRELAKLDARMATKMSLLEARGAEKLARFPDRGEMIRVMLARKKAELQAMYAKKKTDLKARCDFFRSKLAAGGS